MTLTTDPPTVLPWKQPLTCATCGKKMPRGKKSRPQGQARCHPCRRAAGTRICMDCGAPCHGLPRCTPCDRADRARKSGMPDWRPGKVCIVHFPTCTTCGAVFCARLSNQRLCSRECYQARLNESLRAMRVAALAVVGPLNGRPWDVVLREYLRERDGDLCAICRRIINFAVKSGPWGSDAGPSIDHAYARANGGSDEIADLRLAHWGCNRKRGNREQLAIH